MVYAYIGVALLVLLLIVFVTLAVRWLSERVTGNIREHSINLLSEYDDVIEERSRQFEKLKEDALAVIPRAESQEGKKADTSAKQPVSPDSSLKAVERAATAVYRDESLAHFYRKIRSSVPRNPDAVLPLFEDGRLLTKGPATKLLEKLSYDTVYRLSMLSGQEQLDLMEEVLSDEEYVLLDRYLGFHKHFRAIEFYDWLTSISAAEERPVRLTVAPSMAGEHYPSWVEVDTDEDIIEGFMIEKDNVKYDYSIKGREIS